MDITRRDLLKALHLWRDADTFQPQTFDFTYFQSMMLVPNGIQHEESGYEMMTVYGIRPTGQIVVISTKCEALDFGQAEPINPPRMDLVDGMTRIFYRWSLFRVSGSSTITLEPIGER